MNRTHKARWKNALKIAAKVNRILKKGGLVFDGAGEKQVPFTLEDGMIKQTTKSESHTISYIFFENSKDFDHGLYTPIKEYNKRFKDWVFVEPKNVKQLL